MPLTGTDEPSLKVSTPEVTLTAGSARSLSTTLCTRFGCDQLSLIHGLASVDRHSTWFTGPTLDLIGRPSTARCAA